MWMKQARYVMFAAKGVMFYDYAGLLSAKSHNKTPPQKSSYPGWPIENGRKKYFCGIISDLGYKFIKSVTVVDLFLELETDKTDCYVCLPIKK